MAERGRPPKGVERSNLLLRIPTDLIEQVDTFKESLEAERGGFAINRTCLLYTSPSPRDGLLSRMPSSA